MIRVAIVEDQDNIRQALTELICGSEGLECVGAYSNALDAIRGLVPKKADVVLMDIDMPGMSGIECLEKLNGRLADTKFVMCTVFEDDENIFNALKAGAYGYILKRSSAQQIIDSITEVYAGGSPMSSEIARKVVSSFRNINPSEQEMTSLTKREKEILDFLSKGYLYKEIASAINVSNETVKKHIHNIYGKLQVNTRTDALNKAFNKH